MQYLITSNVNIKAISFSQCHS